MRTYACIDAAQRGGQAELQEAVAVYEEQLSVLQATAAGQDAAIEASARASELSHKRYADGLQMCSGGAGQICVHVQVGHYGQQLVVIKPWEAMRTTLVHIEM